MVFRLTAVVVLLLVAAFMPLSVFAEQRVGLERLEQSVQKLRLDNGLVVLVYPRPNLGPIFSGTVNVRVGGVDEPEGKTGIAHMLEHMAFMGTADIGTSDIETERGLLADLERLAELEQSQGELSSEERAQWQALQAQLERIWDVPSLSTEIDRRGGTGLNASTGKDLTRYFVNLPVNAMEFWFWLESERLFHPVLRKFYSERDVVLEERRMRSEDSPTGRLYERFMLTALDVHPYRHPVIGYERDIRGLLAGETLRFHEQYYVPANMVVTVVGNVNPREVFRHARRYFGRIPAGEMPPRDFSPEPPLVESRLVNVEFDAEPILTLGYRVPAYPHTDSPAVDVLMRMLSSHRLTPLQRELVERKKVAQSVSTFTAPGELDPLLQFFWMTPRAPHTPAELLEEFDGVLRQVQLREQDLEVAKRNIQVSYLDGLSSNYAIGLALAQSQIFHNNWRHVLYYFDALQAVTLDDVQRVFSEYFRDKPRVVGVLGRKEVHIQ